MTTIRSAPSPPAMLGYLAISRSPPSASQTCPRFIHRSQRNALEPFGVPFAGRGCLKKRPSQSGHYRSRAAGGSGRRVLKFAQRRTIGGVEECSGWWVELGKRHNVNIRLPQPTYPSGSIPISSPIHRPLQPGASGSEQEAGASRVRFPREA
jgi:hypothetical protein